MREFDLDIIRHITFFEKKTRTNVRDCIVNGESVYFLVESGNIQKAIGKGGANIKKLQSELKKRIKVVEFDKNNEKFIKNLIPEAEDIKISGNRAQLKINSKNKGIIIGKGGSNINNLKELLYRNSDIETLDVK